MISYYKVLFDNLTSYSGSGLMFAVLLICILFLLFTEKNSTVKKMLAVFPIVILAIIFCPVWAVYIKVRNDAVILYRLLWIIPSVIIIGYTIVELIYKAPQKIRPLIAALAVVLIMIGGKYVYSNPQFSKADNSYHIPDTVVKICDEIIVPGREVRACFPNEFVQYVRQYTAYVLQPYGRDVLFVGETYQEHSDIEYQLSQRVADSKILAEALREKDTHYLIIDSDKALSESLWNYDFCYVTTIDGYDIYLDNNAYLGLNAEEK